MKRRSLLLVVALATSGVLTAALAASAPAKEKEQTVTLSIKGMT